MNSESKNINAGALSADNAPLVKYAVILAGGEGHRAGGNLPKQFMDLDGLPLLWWSVKAFHAEDPSTKIILVMHPGFFDTWDIIYSELPEEEKIDVELICGGRSRLESVKNGIMDIPSGDNILVAVHDAARPLVSVDMISRGWNVAAADGAAVPAVAVTDSLRKLTTDGSVAVLRKDYVAVQTPQVFRSSLIKESYNGELLESFTDDASVAEAAGHKITLYEGDSRNMKVTNPLDIFIAEALLRHSNE